MSDELHHDHHTEFTEEQKRDLIKLLDDRKRWAWARSMLKYMALSIVATLTSIAVFDDAFKVIASWFGGGKS